MSNIGNWIFAYFVNSLWQIPLLLTATAATTGTLTKAGWRIQHRLWVASLWLAVALPALSLLSGRTGTVHHPNRSSNASTMTAVEHSPAISDRNPGRDETNHRDSKPGETFEHVILLLYGCATMFGAFRLVWGLTRTQELLKSSSQLELSGNMRALLVQARDRWGIGTIRIRQSTSLSGAVTIGWPSSALVVSTDLLKSSPDDLQAAFFHELAHIKRHDFQKNALYELVSLPIAYHPLLPWIKRRISESREVLCDEMAANLAAGKRSYAQSLLRLAQRISQAPVASKSTHALGIFEADILEKRIMNLINQAPQWSFRRKALSTVTGVVGLALVCAVLVTFGSRPSRAQSMSSPDSYTGIWKMTVDGKRVGTLEIMNYNGKIAGSITNAHAGFDSNGKLVAFEAIPGAAPIVEADISGNMLKITTEEVDGRPTTWNMSLSGEGAGELQLAVEGHPMPPFQIAKISWKENEKDATK
jgi:beta-lactamase regulating signal transducer with metallopeptidase domain